MARHRLIYAFLVLGAVVFLLTRNGRDVTAVGFKPTDISDQADNKNNINAASKIARNFNNEVEMKSDSASLKIPGQVMKRKEVPRNFVRGASSVSPNELVNAQTERNSFFEGTPWKIWVGAKAYPKKNGKPSPKIIGEINGFYLVEESGQNGDIHNFSVHEPLVVIDTRRDIVGVVTGVFTVTLKENASAEMLTQASGIKILNSFPEIRTYYVTSVSDSFDLQAFQDSLKNAGDIEQVQAEVLSRQYEKY